MRQATRKGERDRHLLQQDEPLYLTRSAIERLKRSIERIKAELPEAIAEVTRTQAMGDLSENAAYQEAKYRMRRMQGRLLRKEEELKIAIEIPDAAESDTVTLGSKVTIDSEAGTLTFTIVGPREADPSRDRLSHVSPLGSLLMDKRAGDTVELTRDTGVITYTIRSVE